MASTDNRPTDAPPLDVTALGVWTVFLKALRYMDPRNRRLVWVVAALLLFNACLEALGIGLVFPLIKIVSSPSTAGDFTILHETFGLFNFSDPDQYLYLIIGLILAIFTIKNIFLFTSNIWQMWYVRRNESAVSRTLLWRYLSAPYSMYFHRHSTELIRNLLECVSAMYTGLFYNLIRFATELTLAVAVILALFLVDVRTALIVSISLGAIALLFYRFLRKRIEYWGQRQIMRSKDRLKAAKEITGIVKELKVLGREEFFADLFLTVQLNFARTMLRSGALAEFPRLGLEMMMIWVICGAILWHLSWGSDNIDVIASLGVFAAAAFRLTPSANRLLSALNNVRQHLPSTRVIIDDLENLQIENKRPSAGSASLPIAFQKLELKQVCYRYPKSHDLALSKIDLTIEKGKSIAIVGPSGGGKTTLIDLILGLLSPTAGRLLVNGIDIHDRLIEWRGIVGYVPQAIYLMDDTLKRNIALGVDEDKIDERALRRAIESAQLSRYVDTLPDGVNSEVGEYGIRLSGGQRQRIGIARAIYREPQILILDEATSNLDAETERNFADAINALRGERTTITIAHRLSTIRHCDQVVFLKGGRIQGVGTFDELMGRCPDFRYLVELGRLDSPSETAGVGSEALESVPR